MAETQLDIEIRQGSTFEMLVPVLDINGVALDMTGYVGGTAGARAMIRKRYSDVTATETFTISILNNSGILAAIATGLCHLTSAEIAALLPDTSGKCYLLLRLTATETAAILKGSYVWDCEIEDTYAFVSKPLVGSCLVLAEATK